MKRSTPEVWSFDVAIGSHNGCQTGDGAGNGCTGRTSSARLRLHRLHRVAKLCLRWGRDGRPLSVVRDTWLMNGRGELLLFLLGSRLW